MPKKERFLCMRLVRLFGSRYHRGRFLPYATKHTSLGPCQSDPMRIRKGCTDRGVKHDLNRFSTLLLSQLGLGDYRLALSHDLSHVRNEVLVQEYAEATGGCLGCWLESQKLSAAGSYASVDRNRRHLGHRGRCHPRSRPFFSSIREHKQTRLIPYFAYSTGFISLLRR